MTNRKQELKDYIVSLNENFKDVRKKMPEVAREADTLIDYLVDYTTNETSLFNDYSQEQLKEFFERIIYSYYSKYAD